MFSFDAHNLHSVTVNNVAGDYLRNSTKNVTTNVHIVNQYHSSQRKAPLDCLLENVSLGALHDSAERGPFTPKCHPETRKAVQQEIVSWIRYGQQDDVPKKILWLSGPAGSGKSAIAGTIADQCHKEGMLAASFFFSCFSVSTNRRSKRLLVATLAYRLLQQKSILNLREAILSVIDDDPSVLHKHLHQQLEELILAPLRSNVGQSDTSTWPQVIVVDGVDECRSEEGAQPSVRRMSDEEDHREILSLLTRATNDPAFPFRIVVASRPEPAITEFFDSSPTPPLRLFLDSKYNPSSDIRLFLTAKLSAIHRRYNLPDDWADDAIYALVDNSSGQFSYATTALRYIDDTSRPPQEQLERVLQWQQNRDSDCSPFASLDALYTGILETSPNPPLVAKWLFAMQDLVEGSFDADYMFSVLESFQGEAGFLLGGLQSLVSLTNDYGVPSFRLYHKSLFDFLQDPRRSGKLHVSRADIRVLMKTRHYQILKNRGAQNVATLITRRGGNFLEEFCTMLPLHLDPHRNYEASDIAWWLEQVRLMKDTRMHPFNKESYVISMFAHVDQECHWYRCLPACRLWRKAIIRHCEDESWRRVPTSLDLWADSLLKLRQGDKWTVNHAYLSEHFIVPARKPLNIPRSEVAPTVGPFPFFPRSAETVPDSTT